MKLHSLLTLIVALWSPGAVVADRSRDADSLQRASATSSSLIVAKCGLAIARTPRFDARLLGEGRLEVGWSDGRRPVKLELRFECSNTDFDRLARDAGFVRAADGWVLSTSQGDSRVVLVSSPSWSGVAAGSFQGNVCRSVVGKAHEGGATFFAEFCLPEAEYRRSPKVFDSLEHRLVFSR